jgi:penicillin-insensitive murein endopeptidase
VAAREGAPGPLRVIRTAQGAGCIAGAVRLPESGPGFQTIRNGKTWFWGAPEVIAAVQLLGQRAQAAGLPDLYIGEISLPRGGPFQSGHVSHQTGLDVDIWLDVTPKLVLSAAERENLHPPGVVRADRRAVDPRRWQPEHVTLLHLAATLPGVDRVLVNPAIKKRLCEEVRGDRSWLRLIRPWYGHAAHMHIRFRCPPGQPDCVDGPPPPAGEGCDASLQWWFDQIDNPDPPKPGGPPRPPPVPAACRPILAGR